MKDNIIKFSIFAGSIILAAGLVIALTQTNFVQGNGFLGLVVTQSVATTTTVGPDGDAGVATTIFGALRSCTSRTITTTGASISFLTADPTNGDLSSTSLTITNGIQQASGTSVTYEAGINGCGRWTALSSATSTFTFIEYH